MKTFKLTYNLFILLLIISIISCTACTAQAEKVAPVVVNKPTVNSFTVNPQVITRGESITLTWDVSDADSVDIQPEIGNVEKIGTLILWPSANTTYTLTATNTIGINSSIVRVNIIEETTSSNCVLIGCDPVSGRNQSILLDLEQLCVSTQYQVQIAKNPEFSLLVYDSGPYAPYSTTSPAFIYPAGGIFECGHTYYVRSRVRNTATGQAIISPWSPVECYIIGAGFPVTNPHN